MRRRRACPPCAKRYQAANIAAAAGLVGIAAAGGMIAAQATAEAAAPVSSVQIAVGAVSEEARESWYRNGYVRSTDDTISNGPTADVTSRCTQRSHGRTVARVLCG